MRTKLVLAAVITAVSTAAMAENPLDKWPLPNPWQRQQPSVVCHTTDGRPVDCASRQQQPPVVCYTPDHRPVDCASRQQPQAQQPQRKFCDTACIDEIKHQAWEIFGPAGYQTIAARQWIAIMVANRNGVDMQLGESHTRTTDTTIIHCPLNTNCSVTH
jgi:hypothetical protein